jgi:hypothetical protein
MAKRVAAMPDLPTLQEQGVPGFECYTWNVFLAPARTPKPIVDKLNVHVGCWYRRMHKQQCRRDPDAAQRREITHRIVRYVFIHTGIYRARLDRAPDHVFRSVAARNTTTRSGLPSSSIR